MNGLWWSPSWMAISTAHTQDELPLDVKDGGDGDADDELTQFPVYGSNVHSTTTRFPENRVPTAHEWLQLGVGLGEEILENESGNNDITTHENSNKQQHLEKKKNTHEWEETLWHTETAAQSSESISKKLKHMASSSTESQNNNTILDRQHWMPDQLCLHCSSCQAPFTVFRRRHHCRWCGHVFCNSCSAYFVPYNNTTQRVCQLCRDQPKTDATNTNTDNDTKDKNISDAEAEPKTTPITKPLAPPPTPPTNGCVGQAAAQHLESMAAELLRIHAPMLWTNTNTTTTTTTHLDKNKREWIHQLLTLATRCCATVEPNVRKGDLLDVRPYVKIKRIAGGSVTDCAYLSGVVFRKTVTHKKMAKCLQKPTILLLAGSLDFYARSESHFASLDILFEQETRYLEILINKIMKLKPDIVMVGRSVSRKAQEMLLRADVVLIQHVKASLLNRIARQTGASIVSSTDHIMNQLGTSAVLGRCERFRLVTFRDNEVYDASVEPRNSIEREAALCARQLGDKVWDGAMAVKSGLAKRGVANTYVLLEGCPKNLGCTIVLRGGNRAFLVQVKYVLRFLVHVAYNLRLETKFLRERGAVLRPDFSVSTAHSQSSSLAVDFGSPPIGRAVRPWNGDNRNPNEQGEISAVEHQSILITSVWMAEKSQCCPAEVKGICYYSLQDVALGQFLRDSCFNLSLKCQNPSCKKSVLDHSLAFVHNDGLINITVEEMDTPFPGESDRIETEDPTLDDDDDEADKPILTWTYCKNCRKNVTFPVLISENTWKWSFGKFLEIFFYNRDAVLQECGCPLQSSAVLYYGCDSLAARFAYEPVKPYGVFVRKTLPIVLEWHRHEAMRRLDVISVASSDLFVKFDKHIEKVSREARFLFNSANNRPEHLQTVLSELNRIGSEVDLAAKTLQEKIASVSDSFRESDDVDTVLRFPGLAKRYLFMLMSAWNEKLTATGQAMSAMKKLAGVVGANPGDPLQDELLEGMKRLKELNEQYARYDVIDINQILPSIPNPNVFDDDDEFDDQPDAAIDFTGGVDADVLASRRRLQKSTKGPLPGANERGGNNNRQTAKKTLGTRRQIDDTTSSMESNIPQKSTPGGAVKSAITRFFNRGGREFESYRVDLGIFSEGRPRLAPGVNGIIVPVLDEQLSTIIAYSLVSSEYAKQFKHYSKFEGNSDEQVFQAHRQPPKGKLNEHSGASSLEGTLPSTGRSSSLNESTRVVERKMLNRKKSHIKITFRDYDEKGIVTCKFVCTSYWATQFHAVREVFLSNNSDDAEKDDIEQSYIESLSSAYSWAASGGKSGASFARTNDDRFVMKNISRTELQMFLECSSAYFEYLSKAFFHGLPTVLCKIVGVYQIGVHNRITGKRAMEQVAVMQNIFYNKKISKIFDLKGSLRGRFAAQRKDESSQEESNAKAKYNNVADSDNNSILDGPEQTILPTIKRDGPATLLDGDFLEFTSGRPMPLTDRAKALFQMSILNDTLFLSIINVLDYSILVGVDDESNELVVGIIDFMRQYDILKQMERVGKSLPMVVGSEAPTIIQPPLYKARFTNAMERYFMTVPNTWTTI